MNKFVVALCGFALLMIGCEKSPLVGEQVIVPHCTDYQSVCQLTIGEYNFKVNFNQNQLQAEVPFKFYLTSSDNLPPDFKLSGYIEGVNMYMGKIPLFVEISANEIVAESMFGSCSEAEMVWRIYLNVSYSVNQKMQEHQRFFDVTSRH
ncbi:MAG: hypothetical protein ACSHW0_13375 [Thalassotalea sp.]